jgi:hypothetical protein
VDPGDVIVVPPHRAHGFAELLTPGIRYLLIRFDPPRVIQARGSDARIAVPSGADRSHTTVVTAAASVHGEPRVWFLAHHTPVPDPSPRCRSLRRGATIARRHPRLSVTPDETVQEGASAIGGENMSDVLRDQLQRTLGDAFTLERELGGGGMSRVFVAHEAGLGRRVVVKVLAPELGAGVNVERFRREITLAAALQHPHIVPLLSAGAGEGMLYYTMPFIDGLSLRDRLGRGGELAIREAITILREVADALSYAHRQGVVHRDM